MLANQNNQLHSYNGKSNEQLLIAYVKKERRKRRSLVICITLLTFLLLISIAALAATVWWFTQNPSALPGETEPQVTTPAPTDPDVTEPPAAPQKTPSTAEVVEKIKPSVVLIEVGRSDSSGSGTGFFLSDDGYIATNYHVVEGAMQIRVTLYDGRAMSAELIGYRAEDDLAIIKIPGTKYPPLAIGDSDVLMAGDVAIAVGNPGGAEGGWTTTKGIISATNRILSVEEASYFSEMKMLQTDAQVNPGNSGGPLCNEKGEVIGIITRKMSDYEGMGYAIPITDAMRTLTAILEGKLYGFVSSVSQSRPKIGITGSEIAKGEKFTLDGKQYSAPVDGFFVLEVSAGSGAYGKIEVGDILCSLNGETVTDFASFKNELYKCYVGQKVTFELYRKGQKITVQVIVGMS